MKKDLDIRKNYYFLDFSRFLPFIFGGIFIFFLVTTLIIYRSYAMAFFGAGIFYIVFRGVHARIRNVISLKSRDTVAASVSTLLVVLVVMIPLVYMVYVLIQEAILVSIRLKFLLNPDNINMYSQKYHWFMQSIHLSENDILKIQEKIIEYSQELGIVTLKESGNFFAALMTNAANFLLSMVILFFLFKSGRKVPEFLYANIPFPDEMEKAVGARMVAIFDAVVKGNLAISVIQGIFLGIYFWIFGLSTPVLYGTIASFFALIPFVGTSVVWLPGSLYLYFYGDPLSALLLAILGASTYLILENLAKPLVLDKKLKVHPLFLFLAILGGLAEFGIKGLIMGPFVVTAFLTLLELIRTWNNTYGLRKPDETTAMEAIPSDHDE